MKKIISFLAVCLLLAAMTMGASANADVSAMIRQLPTVETFQAMDADAQLEAYNQVQAAYDAYMTLTEREADVLKMRFGMYDGRTHTLEEVGQIFGVTRERIRQIENKAIRKLRHPSRAKKIRDFYC